MLPRSYVPRVPSAIVLMLPRSYVPNVLCFQVPIFPLSSVPGVTQDFYGFCGIIAQRCISNYKRSHWWGKTRFAMWGKFGFLSSHSTVVTDGRRLQKTKIRGKGFLFTLQCWRGTHEITTYVLNALNTVNKNPKALETTPELSPSREM